MERKALSSASPDGETQIFDRSLIINPGSTYPSCPAEREPSPDSAFSHQTTAGGVIAAST
jgi:hypothetical protein